jgi:hypothetical protein
MTAAYRVETMIRLTAIKFSLGGGESEVTQTCPIPEKIENSSNVLMLIRQR